MKHTLAFLLTAAAGGMCAAGPLPQTGSGETGGYRLVWQDLFDADEINRLRWNVEVSSSGSGNHELQSYRDSLANVRLGDDGEGNRCLILTARRGEAGGRPFSSGRVNSAGFVAFTHGKVEASIKLPLTTDGLWPAFWMMGDDYRSVGWPACGETDILEMGHANGIQAGTQDRLLNGACHWGAAWPNISDVQDRTFPYSLQDGRYHLFTLIWDEERASMYVDLDLYPDQEPYFSLDISKVDPSDPSLPGNYFHKDNFIIFNLAVGGDFPGIHDPAQVTALNDDNGHEASMYVNYVKIYQKGTDGDSLHAAVGSDPLDAHLSPSSGLADLASGSQEPRETVNSNTEPI